MSDRTATSRSRLGWTDPYTLKRGFARINDALDLAGASADVSFLRRARRAVLPLPLVDRPQRVDSDVFPRFRSHPAPALAGKRIAVVPTGGSGACAGMVGVARAFEEAGLRPELISACSGSAIWSSMWAAGMTAQEMADFTLSWRPEDYLDIQWGRIPRFVLSAFRGFSGLAKGRAIEQLFDHRLWGMRAGETKIPLSTIVYNMDLGRVEYFGSEATPEVTIGELVRIAIALPLFIESVPVRGHLYVDGGIVDLFPAAPVIAEGGFDHVLGVNFMLPPQFEPEDITGWGEARAGILRASRQLEQGYHLELARRSRDRLGEKLTIIDPVDHSLLRGVSFYDLFIDRSAWPELMRSSHRAAVCAIRDLERAATRTPVRV